MEKKTGKANQHVKQLISEFTVGYCLSQYTSNGTRYEEYLSNKNDGTTIIFKVYDERNFDVLKSTAGTTIEEVKSFLK